MDVDLDADGGDEDAEGEELESEEEVGGVVGTMAPSSRAGPSGRESPFQVLLMTRDVEAEDKRQLGHRVRGDGH